MQGQRKLFDVVVVVGLKQETQGDKVKIVPFVKYKYPSNLSADLEKSLIKPMTEFCFPDTTRYQPENYNWRKKVKSETFSFVLTEGTGDKRWGYCRMTIPGECAKSATDYPICFCVTSLVPCFTIFSQVLDRMESQIENGLDSCNSFLTSLYSQPLPAPGGSIIAGGFTFQRPNDSDSLLDHVNFEPLLRFLDTDTILSLFASLLVERRVIFTADSLSTLSATVQAAIAVLYPFIWQHIFIPVLPQSLLSFCCAPMPFVVGILRSAIPELESMQRSGAVEDVIFIDIDKNKVSIPQGMDDARLLPWDYTEHLYHAIDTTSKAVKQKYSNFLVRGVRGVGRGGAKAGQPRKGEMSKVDTKDFANSFIGFMVDMLADYRNYITPSGEKKFDLDGFIQHKPPEFAELLRLVGECQMFEMFIRDRMSHPIPKVGAKPAPAGGRFEKRISTYRGSSKLNGTKPAPSKTLRQATAPSSAPPPVPTSGDGKAPLTRFTMYEMGDISREEVTRSVAPVTNANSLANKKSGGSLTFSVDHTSFKKLASAEDLRNKDKRLQLGIDLDNENALSLLVGGGSGGSGGSSTVSKHYDSLPAPPPPPQVKGGPSTKPAGESSIAGAIGEASHHLSARLTSAASLARSLPKKTKGKLNKSSAPAVSAPIQVKKTTDSVEAKTLRYEVQEVHPTRQFTENATRGPQRAEKAKSMSVIVDNRVGGGGDSPRISPGAPRTRPGGTNIVKGRTAEWEKKDFNTKETQDVLKRWRENK